MTALWEAGRTWLVTSWLRWHLPVTRQTALDYAEQEGTVTFNVLLRRIQRLEELVVLFSEVPAGLLPGNRGAELKAEAERRDREAWPPAGYPPSRPDRHGMRAVKS